jgi:hypothetical protein
LGRYFGGGNTRRRLGLLRRRVLLRSRLNGYLWMGCIQWREMRGWKSRATLSTRYFRGVTMTTTRFWMVYYRKNRLPP